jgi:PPOX class probable F420-dependent enzyme
MSPSQLELWQIIASRQHGVLATTRADGAPQMSNVLYVPEDATHVLRLSTTADRFKSRNLERDPRAALHVAGDDFWQYAVAQGAVTLSEVAATPGDAATDELFAVHSTFYGQLDRDTFDDEMIRNQRRVVRLHIASLYGVISTGGRRPAAAVPDTAELPSPQA